MTKLRLAVFNTQPPTYLGGVERRILEVAKRLHDAVETTVYSGTKGGLTQPARVEDVLVVPLKSTDYVFPLDNWTFNRALAKRAGVFDADVFEAHTASGYGLLRAFQKKGRQVAFVQTVHGVLGDEYLQGKLQGANFRSSLANQFMCQLAGYEKEAANNATLVVTISEYSKKKLLDLYGVAESKIRIVPNGVDTERFTPEGDCAKIKHQLNPTGRPTVLFVGRLIPRKGLCYLVDAAKYVVNQYPQTLFIIAGDGPLKASLKADVDRLNLGGNFLFLGDVAEVDLPALYRCVDVFAFPSVQEGQGIALLEAQASGKPVAAFNVSAISETVHSGETGLLVKPSSTGELGDAIVQLLSDAELRTAMGAKGRSFVQNQYTWALCAKGMLHAYTEAIELTRHR